MQCSDAATRSKRGADWPPIPNTREGRELLKVFQRSIYEAVLGTPDRVFVREDEEPLDAALPMKRYRPEHKERVSELWDVAVSALRAARGEAVLAPKAGLAPTAVPKIKAGAKRTREL